jgi:hypothetical protein
MTKLKIEQDIMAHVKLPVVLNGVTFTAVYEIMPWKNEKNEWTIQIEHQDYEDVVVNGFPIGADYGSFKKMVKSFEGMGINMQQLMNEAAEKLIGEVLMKKDYNHMYEYIEKNTELVDMGDIDSPEEIGVLETIYVTDAEKGVNVIEFIKGRLSSWEYEESVTWTLPIARDSTNELVSLLNQNKGDFRTNVGGWPIAIYQKYGGFEFEVMDEKPSS